jgi:hypothetical protein
VTASGSQRRTAALPASRVDDNWFGHLAQTEKPRLGEGSGAVKALPVYAPGVSLQSLTSTHPPRTRQHIPTPPIKSHPPVRAKFGAILRGAMTFRVRHSSLQLAGVMHGTPLQGKACARRSSSHNQLMLSGCCCGWFADEGGVAVVAGFAVEGWPLQHKQQLGDIALGYADSPK